MARVDWKVSVTPIAQTGVSSEGGGGLRVETVTLDVKGGVGGGNSKGLWTGADIGNWANGVCTYVNAASNTKVAVGSDEFIFVKNTGRVFDSSVTTGKNVNLGADGTLVPVLVRLGASSMCQLEPGEAICMPNPKGDVFANCTTLDETAPAVQILALD